MKHNLLMIAALAISGTSAMADGTGDWTGFYVGLQYSLGEVDDGFNDFDVDAFGIHGGYHHDLGSYVIGGEFSFDTGDIEDAGAFGDLESETTRLKAIAGYDLGEFLPYVIVGVGDLDIEGFGSETGLIYGVGGSYKASETFRISAEYLIEEYDDFEGGSVNVDTDILELRASFNF